MLLFNLMILLFCFHQSTSNDEVVDEDAAALELLEIQTAALQKLVSDLEASLQEEYKDCLCNETLSKISMEMEYLGFETAPTNVSSPITLRSAIQPELSGEEYLEYQTNVTFEDCQQVYEAGFTKSGVYQIWMVDQFDFLPLYCDMRVGNDKGWMTFLRRFNGKTPFNETKEVYLDGFGDPNEEFWVGTDNLFALARSKTWTSRGNQARLRVDAMDFDGNRAYAEYADFSVGTRKENYKITVVSGYNGTLGDGLIGHLDNEFIVCGDNGGWWWKNCDNATSVNGDFWTSMFWPTWNKKLRSVSMKVQRFIK